MKKLFIKITSILIFCSINIGIINAQHLTLPQSNACLNDTTLVPINFSNIDSLAALTLYVSYDTAVLTYAGFENVNALTPGIMCGVPTSGSNAWQVVVSWVDNTLSGINLVSGKLFDLKFRYKGGSSNLNFLTTSELANQNLINIIPTYTNGSISPTILSHPVSTQICEMGQTSFAVTSASGCTYQWQVQNGAQWDNLLNNSTYSGVNANVLQVLQALYALNNKVYRCVVTKSCSQISNTATLTVYPKPVIVLNNDTTICAGNSVILNASGTTGTGTLLYNWDQSLGLGIAHTVTPLSTTTYHLLVIDANACNSTDSIQVNVNQLPSLAGTITGSTTVCQGQNGVTYNVPAINYATSYVWTLPSAASGTSTTNSITVNYSTSSVSGLITVKGNNSCGNGATSSLAVTVNPLPAMTNLATETTCGGTSPNIALTSSIASNFAWTIGTITGGVTGASASSGSTINQILSNPSNTSAGSVHYIVTPTSISGGCVGNSSTITVTVNPIPLVTNTATATTCSGVSPNITLTSSVASNFSWTIGSISGSISGASSGSGTTINQTLTNPSNTSAGSVQYLVTPTSITGSCVGPVFAITVSVNPSPAITNTATASNCSGTSPNIALTSSIASSFAWTLGSITGSITGASASSGSSINQVLTNPSHTVSGTVQYIVTPTSTGNGCIGIPFTITVTLNPSPSVTNAATYSSCGNTSPNIALTSSVASSYTWTIGSISGSITGASASSGTSINQTLTNPSNTTAGSVQYIVTPTSNIGSCVGNTFSITVTVNPIPIVSNTATATTCNGSSPNISLSSTVPSNFSWTVGSNSGSITGASSGSGATINQTLTNPSNTTVGSVQYLVTPTSITGSCVGPAFTITVLVNPSPAVTNTATASNCSGVSPNIALTSSIASSFAWTIGSITGGITGATASSGSTINQVLTNPSHTVGGTVQYLVSPTSTGNGCVGIPFTITVTVNPSPSVTNAAAYSSCGNTSPNIALTSSISSNFSWTIGTISGSISGASASSGTTINQTLTNPSNTTAGSIQYLVIPTSTANTCVGATFTITVTVNPIPLVTNTATATTCSGSSPNISLSSSVPSNFSWTIGSNTGSITGASSGSGATINQTLTNPSNTTAGSIQYLVTPTSNPGSCVGAAFTITITVNPAPSVTNVTTASVCSGLSPNIVLTSSIASSYSWTIGTVIGGITGATASSGSTINQVLTNPSHTVSGTVQYLVTPTSTGNGCMGIPFTITVTVNPSPSVTNVATVSSCGNTSPNITLTSSIASNFSWTIGAITGSITGASAGSGTVINQILTNPGNTTAGSVQYLVIPTSTANTCLGSTFTITATVNPIPAVTNAIAANACSGSGPNISLTASTASNFAWTIGTITGGVTGASAGSGAIINQILTNPGTTTATVQYLVTPTSVAGSCLGSVFTMTITVNPLPSAAGTITGTITVCQGQNAVIYSVPAITNATSYTWTLPTGANGSSTTNTITVNYSTTAVSGNVTVKGHNSCGDGLLSSLSITVNSLPTSAGSITGLSTLCQGTSSITYSIPTISNATSYSWTLPIGAIGSSTSNTITVNYLSTAVSGNIVVKGINACGIGDSSILAITIHHPITGTVGAITGLATVCQGQTAVVYNVPAIANAASYIWTLPTGASGSSTTNTISVNYSTIAVSGKVVVKGSNSCGIGDSSLLLITVNPLVGSSGTITGLTTVCQGQTGVIYNVPAIAFATSYIWTLPTGASGTSVTATITVAFSTTAASGKIVVKGSNSCGIGDSSFLVITLNPLPAAAAAITSVNNDSVSINENNVLYIVPVIANATSYIWSYSGTGASFVGGGTTTTDSVRINFSTSATSGNLSVKGHNACGDGVVSANYPIYVSPVGIGEITHLLNCSIYPNPTKGIITVEMDAVIEKSELILYNLQGETIYSEILSNTNKKLIKQLNLSTYPKGIYFIKIQNNKFVKVEKVILQ
ncbi:MAG: PKD-like domain-containing protein [Bacteroidales bacterium]